MELDLKGRVAIVTGGGSGFGRATALLMAKHGAVAAVADRDATTAQRTVDLCKERGLQALPFTVDVGDPKAVEAMVGDVVRRCGGLDILVNSAGIIKTGRILDSTPEDWTEVESANLAGTLHCARAAAAVMVPRRWGRIINISSISAARGGGTLGNTLYAMTKAGVIAFTMGLARELGPSGITVNAIVPSIADTPMTQGRLTAEMRAAAEKRIPLGRMATPDDIANAALFLASQLADYVSGAAIPVDGGILTT